MLTELHSCCYGHSKVIQQLHTSGMLKNSQFWDHARQELTGHLGLLVGAQISRDTVMCRLGQLDMALMWGQYVNWWFLDTFLCPN